MTDQSRTESARCGAPLAHHPAPSPNVGEGESTPHPNPLPVGEGVDSRLRGNDQRLGAMNRTPTGKTYPCQGRGVRGGPLRHLLTPGMDGRRVWLYRLIAVLISGEGRGCPLAAWG